MFDPVFYLRLVNEAYAKELKAPIQAGQLSKHPRITVRLGEFFKANPLKGKAKWNHYRPARYLLDNLTALTSDIDKKTRTRFEEMFEKVKEGQAVDRKALQEKAPAEKEGVHVR